MNLELLLLVLQYHAGQMRVGNREDGLPDPQIEHLLRVVAKLSRPCPHFPPALLLVLENARPMIMDVALAHDLMEDTSITKEELERVIHPHAMKSVEALTRKEGETYQEYIEKRVTPNPMASIVKLADLEDNEQNAKPSLRERYAKARQSIIDVWKRAVFPPPNTILGKDVPEGLQLAPEGEDP